VVTTIVPRLEREIFRTSRLLEFCSRKELVAQTGHDVEDWPLVALKELIDNAIDIAEEIGVAPKVEIAVSTETGEIVVTDNGPGIRAATVDAILDYAVRASSREAYVSPTRAAQGNALKTIVAMPFVLDGTAGETVIEARRTAHRIRFTVDPIRQEPRVTCDRGTSPVRTGTRVTVRWPEKASHLLIAARGRFLPLALGYAGLNPHLAITADWNSDRRVDWTTPSDPGWEKWRPFDPIPAHWYTPERLQRYIAACVNRDMEHGERVRSVRDFVAGFRGLRGTAKRAAVLEETGLARAPLSAFFDGDRVDHAGIARLLATMQDHSRPVKPEVLGLIGENHWREAFLAIGADLAGFKYSRILGHDQDLPFVVETAFAPGPDYSVISGINWSAALHDPFRSLGPTRGSLFGVLVEQRAAHASVLVGVHLATPTIQFVDRGKSTVVLGAASADAVIKAVQRVTKDWAEKKKRRERLTRQAERYCDEQEKEARVKSKRRRSITVGTGALYREIAKAAEEAEISINDLTVLSRGNDPYLRDTTDGHRDGKWFSQQVARFLRAGRQVHLRGLHYAIVVAGGVRRPDGSPFINDLDCWIWLQTKAAKAARWLGYVQFERIRDERNEPPRVISYADPQSDGEGYLARGSGIDLPEPDALLPRLGGVKPVGVQPNRIILIGEKSSLAEVLEPIAQQVKGELLLPTGEMSDTMIAEMAARAAADGRPAVALYFSDFDPSGHQMPISVSRKLQALRTLLHPDLQIEVHRVALTLEQVRELALPSTPLKSTEKRAGKWRERMGHEQTEIDALAALQPNELRRIALEAVAPFFDFMLDQRCDAAFEEWRAQAQKQLADHPDRGQAEQSIWAAVEDVKEVIAALERAQADALARLQEGDAGILPTLIPRPEVEIEAEPQAPLFTTDDNFVTATRKLIASKALDELEHQPDAFGREGQ
jgi:Histidine kinase-, DNA gyrase B-, and HSP90-like ATPase